jgi:hypothetical protein
MKKSILAAAFLVGTQLTVIACQPAYRGRSYSYSERQERQRDRIDEGRAEGDLSRREAARLRDRSRDVAEDRRDARADDGYVDRRERRQLQKEQDRLNRDIYQQRHDDDGR